MKALRLLPAVFLVLVVISAVAAPAAPASAPNPAAQPSSAAALSPVQPQASLPPWSATILQRSAATGPMDEIQECGDTCASCTATVCCYWVEGSFCGCWPR
jgi:hypothetical protein